jgi:thioredoxin-related protein
MKKGTILSLAIAAFAMLAFSISEADNLNIGDQAPKASQKMISTKKAKLSLNDLKKENGLIVVFSCNTCPFVVGGEAFGGWEKTYNEYAAKAEQKGFGFVLINSNEAKRDKDDSMDAMVKRAEQKSYAMPYLLDKNSELADAFGAKTTPHVFMLDKDMKLVYKGSIDNTWDSKRENDIPYLRNAMEALSKGRAISENSTAPRGCSIKRK